jgi:hypothetical protein
MIGAKTMVKVIVLATVIPTTAAIHDLGYSITKYDESPRLYYENKYVAEYELEDKFVDLC